MSLERGPVDLDSAGQWRMVADERARRIHELETQLSQAQATVDKLRSDLAVVWALLETRKQADMVEQRIAQADIRTASQRE